MSAADDTEIERDYLVLVNHEEQHSLWLAHKTVPAGWRVVFGPRPKSECFDYVEQSWKDITPLSVRSALGAGA